MAVSPTLETTRLRLVPFAERHLTERYVGWLNDPDVVRYSEQRHRRHSLDSCRRYFESLAGSSDHFWAIEAKDPALGHIGNITVTVDEPNRVGDVAILLGEKSAWGGGLGGEAWGEVCRFLLAEGAMRKVSAGTMATNHAMLGIMRRTGMIEEGRRPRHFLLDGAEVDLIYVALYEFPPARR